MGSNAKPLQQVSTFVEVINIDAASSTVDEAIASNHRQRSLQQDLGDGAQPFESK